MRKTSSPKLNGGIIFVNTAPQCSESLRMNSTCPLCDNYCCDLGLTVNNYCASLLITVQPSALHVALLRQSLCFCGDQRWLRIAFRGNSGLQMCEMLGLHAASVSHNQHGGSKTSPAARATVASLAGGHSQVPHFVLSVLNKASFSPPWSGSLEAATGSANSPSPSQDCQQPRSPCGHAGSVAPSHTQASPAAVGRP